MRFRHIFSETFAGLRQNLTMTLAVVMTMWVSLSLFGAGLLANQQVDLFKGNWYDKIEISVFLCTPDVSGEQCEPGQGVTEAQKDTIRQTLESNPEVAPGGVYFETKQEAWDAFQKAYANSPIQDSLTVDQMQESFRVKLKNPEQYEGVVSSVVGLKGVQAIQDLKKYLDPLFSWLRLLQWGTIGASVLLLLAAALQIGNTIRLAAFARRREIGIMRLVGASNLYITLPFLFEAVICCAYRHSVRIRHTRHRRLLHHHAESSSLYSDFTVDWVATDGLGPLRGCRRGARAVYHPDADNDSEVPQGVIRKTSTSIAP